MLYGLYQSAQGANVQARRLEVTAHNLANTNTTAFKQDMAVIRTVPQFAEMFGDAMHQMDIVERGLTNHNGATAIADVVTDFSNGSIQETGGTYDIAMRGPGFFRVTDGEKTFLTRNGSFVTDMVGNLVTADTGLNVLDINDQKIVIPPESIDVHIGTSGVISDQRGPITSLAVLVPGDTADLQKLGDSLYGDTADAVKLAPELVRMMQGHLESSTVEPMAEMLSMIETSRAFEMNMNMVQYQDSSLGRLLNAVGQV